MTAYNMSGPAFFAGGAGGAAAIQALFASGEQGGWWDATDLLTLFQDPAFTLPVTAVEQTVGGMLDKRLAPINRNSNPTNSNWNVEPGWVNNGGGTYTATNTTGAISFFYGAPTVDTGKLYEVSLTVSNYGGGQFDINVMGNTSRMVTTGNGRYRLTVVGGVIADSSIYVDANNAAPFTGVISNIQVRELPGNHLTQATPANEPVLSALNNMFLKTELFTDAFWGKTNVTMAAGAVAPNGTTTAQIMNEGVTAALDHYVSQGGINFNQGGIYTASCYFKKGAGSPRFANIVFPNGAFAGSPGAVLDMDTGAIDVTVNCTAQVTPAGDGWWRLSATSTCTTTAAGAPQLRMSDVFDVAPNYAGNGSTMMIWGAQLEGGANTSRYQRVNTASDYDSVGFPIFLRFAGTTQDMTFAALPATGDKAMICVAQRKEADINFASLISFTTAPGTTNASWQLTAPNSTPPFRNYSQSVRGTINVNNATASGSYPAPHAAVLTGIVDFAGSGTGTSAQNRLRVNGVQVGGVSGAGTSPFVTSPLFMGRTGAAGSPYTGRFYSAVVRFALSTLQQIIDTERALGDLAGIGMP